MKHLVAKVTVAASLLVSSVDRPRAEEIDLTCLIIKETFLGRSPPIDTSNAGFHLVIDLDRNRVTLMGKEAFDVQIGDELIEFKTQSPFFTGLYRLNRYTGYLLVQIMVGNASYECRPAKRKF